MPPDDRLCQDQSSKNRITTNTKPILHAWQGSTIGNIQATEKRLNYANRSLARNIAARLERIVLVVRLSKFSLTRNQPQTGPKPKETSQAMLSPIGASRQENCLPMNSRTGFNRRALARQLKPLTPTNIEKMHRRK